MTVYVCETPTKEISNQLRLKNHRNEYFYQTLSRIFHYYLIIMEYKSEHYVE